MYQLLVKQLQLEYASNHLPHYVQPQCVGMRDNQYKMTQDVKIIIILIQVHKKQNA